MNSRARASFSVRVTSPLASKSYLADQSVELALVTATMDRGRETAQEAIGCSRESVFRTFRNLDQDDLEAARRLRRT